MRSSRLSAVLSLVATAYAASAYAAPVPPISVDAEVAELPRWISFSSALIPDTDVTLHWTGLADGDAWTIRAVPAYDNGEDLEAVDVMQVPGDQSELKWHFPASASSKTPIAYRFCITDASADVCATWGDCTGQVPVSQGSVEEDVPTGAVDSASAGQVVLQL